MAPASLARRTSRDSRSASFVISSGVRALPSRTPPLITRRGFALAKSRRPLAASTGSPSTNAMADGPTSWPSNAVTPASLAASSVSVFFTTAKVAFPRSALRRSVICFTVSPRYSVSTAAPELRNLSDSSAMAAALSALAMGPPFRVCDRPEVKAPHGRSPVHRARGSHAEQAQGAGTAGDSWPALDVHQSGTFGHVLPLAVARDNRAVFGQGPAYGSAASPPNREQRPPVP